MTDQQNYTDRDGDQLTIKRAKTVPDALLLDVTGEDSSLHAGVIVPATQLLAMIDTLAPDAMRAYLRERSDLMDSPYDLRDAVPEWPAPDALESVRVTPEQLDAVPEADSPEDTDEPDPLEEIREAGRQLGESWSAMLEGFRSGRGDAR